MKITSKRRRTRAQIELEKKEAAEREAMIAKKLGHLDELERKMGTMQAQLEDAANMNEQVQGMFSQGKLKVEADGKLNVVENPLEQQMLQLSQQDDPQSQEQASQIQ